MVRSESDGAETHRQATSAVNRRRELYHEQRDLADAGDVLPGGVERLHDHLPTAWLSATVFPRT